MRISVRVMPMKRFKTFFLFQLVKRKGPKAFMGWGIKRFDKTTTPLCHSRLNHPSPLTLASCSKLLHCSSADTSEMRLPTKCSRPKVLDYFTTVFLGLESASDGVQARRAVDAARAWRPNFHVQGHSIRYCTPLLLLHAPASILTVDSRVFTNRVERINEESPSSAVNRMNLQNERITATCRGDQVFDTFKGASQTLLKRA